MGTADAIYENFYTLQQERPDLVLVLSGDHIYKMDYRPMIEEHLKEKGGFNHCNLRGSRIAIMPFRSIAD